MASTYVRYPATGGGSGVSSLNGQTGALSLVAGSNITITPGAGTLTIAASGTGSFPLLAPNGTVGAPSYSFSSETNSGLYLLSGSDVALSVNGSLKAHWSATEYDVLAAVRISGALGLYLNDSSNTFAVQVTSANTMAADYTITLPAAAPASNTFLKYDGSNYVWAATSTSFPLLAPDGTAGAPSYSFSNETDLGIFRASGSALAISVGGNQKAQFSTNALEMSTFINVPDGTAAQPIITFTNDTNTGVYRSATDTLAVSAGGTLTAEFKTAALDVAVGAILNSYLQVKTTTVSANYVIT